MRTTAAVVLAAGRGARVRGARPKPLLRFRGRPLVALALDAALGSGLEPVLLVVGHGSDAVAAAAPAGSVVVVESPQWAEGISQSLRAALDRLEDAPGVGAACIGLADQPRVGAEAYRRLARAGDAGAAIAVATYRGVRANPVLLARRVWPEARALAGEEGARQLMDGRVVEVDCTGTGDPADVDTLEDLEALERWVEPPSPGDDG